MTLCNSCSFITYFDISMQRSTYKYIFCPALIGREHYALMTIVCPCLTLSRERKGVAIWKLEGGKLWPVTPLKGQRSPGRLTPWPKVSRIFVTGRSTNFKLDTRVDYHDRRGDLKEYMSPRQFDTLPITRQGSRRSTEIGRKVVPWVILHTSSKIQRSRFTWKMAVKMEK